MPHATAGFDERAAGRPDSAFVLFGLGLLVGAGMIFAPNSRKPETEVRTAAIRMPTPLMPSFEADGAGKPLFFGYLEFDWDGTAPEEVPGFGSVPPSATPVEVASVN